jgi:hypothetical protein
MAIGHVCVPKNRPQRIASRLFPVDSRLDLGGRGVLEVRRHRSPPPFLFLRMAPFSTSVRTCVSCP